VREHAAAARRRGGERQPAPRAPAGVAAVLALQRGAGNRATAAYLARSSDKVSMPGLEEKKPQKTRKQKRKKRQNQPFSGEVIEFTVPVAEQDEKAESDTEEKSPAIETEVPQLEPIETKASSGEKVKFVNWLEALLPARAVKANDVVALTKTLCAFQPLIAQLDDTEVLAMCIVIDRLIFCAPDRPAVVQFLVQAHVIANTVPKTVKGDQKGAVATGFALPTVDGIQILSLPAIIAEYKQLDCATCYVNLNRLENLHKQRLLANSTFVKMLKLKIKKELTSGNAHEFEDGELDIPLSILRRLKELTDAINSVNKDKEKVPLHPAALIGGTVYDPQLLVDLEVAKRHQTLMAYIKQHAAELKPMTVYGTPLLEWIADQEDKNQCNNVFATLLGVRIDTLLVGERGPGQLQELIERATANNEWLEPEVSMDDFPAERKK